MMAEGAEWRVTSREAFSGQGSLGNGSAMRVAPVCAWFASDLDCVVKEARASAMVTHMHSEGVAGAVAIAVAAAMAWRLRGNTSPEATLEFSTRSTSARPIAKRNVELLTLSRCASSNHHNLRLGHSAMALA